MSDKRFGNNSPTNSFDCAIIEADGTQIETSAEKKQGIDITYKGQWG
ncbi:hypothetical protein [Rosistilla oblonga]